MEKLLLHLSHSLPIPRCWRSRLQVRGTNHAHFCTVPCVFLCTVVNRPDHPMDRANAHTVRSCRDLDSFRLACHYVVARVGNRTVGNLLQQEVFPHRHEALFCGISEPGPRRLLRGQGAHATQACHTSLLRFLGHYLQLQLLGPSDHRQRATHAHAQICEHAV